MYCNRNSVEFIICSLVIDVKKLHVMGATLHVIYLPIKLTMHILGILNPTLSHMELPMGESIFALLIALHQYIVIS